MTGGKRDYKKENRLYNSRPEVIKRRVERNKAQRMMEKKLGRKISDDIDHIKPLTKGGKTTYSNLRVRKPSKNRSFRRNRDSSIR